MDTCGNCERVIGKLETPHLWNDQIVCAECRKRLESSGTTTAGELEVVDEAGSWPPRPKKPLFSVSRTEVVPMQRVRALLIDPDTRQESTHVVAIHGAVSPEKMREWAKKNDGAILKRVTILERFWEIQDNPSALENTLTAIGFFSLFTR